MSSAYENLPRSAFWRTGVVEAATDRLEGIYSPKFLLDSSAAIATAGSCFAQHIGRALRETGMNVLDLEPPPPGLSGENAARYGYGLYSARYGNIYSVRQLRQLLEDALSDKVREEDFWFAGARVHDGLRPNVDPDGLDSVEEAIFLRRYHLAQVRRLVALSDVFVFTAGLTETWMNRLTGTAYPIAPQVIASPSQEVEIEFHNMRFAEILADLEAVRSLLQEVRPGIQMLVTVSPVPLTATASGKHVLEATNSSKATLRAALGEFAERNEDVDYVPSYEIVTNPAARGNLFAPNLRSVTQAGVAIVIGQFLLAHGLTKSTAPRAPFVANEFEEKVDGVVCEEALLEAFGK